MENDKGKRKLRWPKWFIAVMALIVLGSGAAMIHRFRQIDIIKNEIVSAESQLKDVQKENEDLKKEQEELNNNSSIERIAREELGMSKQGEMPYIYNKKTQDKNK